MSGLTQDYAFNSRVMGNATLLTSLLQSDLGDSDFRLIGWETIKDNAPAGPLNIPRMMGEVEQKLLHAGKPLVDNAHQLFAKFAEKLKPELKAIQFPEKQLQITELRLTEMQERLQSHYENEALETIWKQRLATQLNQQNNPNLQTHEQIRAWFNDPDNAPLLQQITTLDLPQLGLKALPPEIGALTNLQTLNLYNNQLRTLPAEISALGNLRELFISDNQLRSLPSQIGSLGDLEVLVLSNNQLSSLPTEIGLLGNLQQLNLAHNMLSSLPAEIGNLGNLEMLHLAHNMFSSLSAEICNLGNLEILHLTHNKFSSLPAEIGNLGNLHMFFLQNNQLRSLPPEIGNLTNLYWLSLTSNQLLSLPLEINALGDLQGIDSNDNPWMFISDQKLAKKPSVAAFLQFNKKFAEYPTQSSLGNLFKLIARGEDAATIQNTFEELDDKLQSKIIELANANVLVPVAASSNWTPSADENLFTDMPRLSRAVKKAAMERFENLTKCEKNRVYGKIYEFAGNPITSHRNWGKHHAFNNMLRFIDALEAVTKEL